MNSAAAMAERCGSDFALTFGGVGHFQRNPGKAFSTRQARRAPAPVGEEGRRWSGRPQRTRLPSVQRTRLPAHKTSIWACARGDVAAHFKKPRFEKVQAVGV